MAWMKKGIWGIDLRKQTIGIAIFYMCLSLLGLVFGFIMIHSPDKFLTSEQREWREEADRERSEEESAATTADTADEIRDGELASPERKDYEHLIKRLKGEGVEIVIGALLTLFFSGMLVFGARKSKSVWFMPWIVQQSVELFVGVGMFIIRTFAGAHYSMKEVILFVVYLVVSSYFAFSVLSHYILVRRMDKHAAEIIHSVMDNASYAQSSSTVSYERLQEEGGKEMTNMTSTTTTTTTTATTTAAAATAATVSSIGFGDSWHRQQQQEEPAAARKNNNDIFFSID